MAEGNSLFSGRVDWTAPPKVTYTSGFSSGNGTGTGGIPQGGSVGGGSPIGPSGSLNSGGDSKLGPCGDGFAMYIDMSKLTLTPADVCYPIGNVIVNSAFGYRNAGSVGTKYHPGVDMSGSPQPVFAFADGTVIEVCSTVPSCNSVTIDHHQPGGLYTVYLHMNPVSVKKGQNVKKGERIGTLSNYYRGAKVGNHLHFEVLMGGTRRRNSKSATDLGNAVDPERFLRNFGFNISHTSDYASGVPQKRNFKW